MVHSWKAAFQKVSPYLQPSCPKVLLLLPTALLTVFVLLYSDYGTQHYFAPQGAAGPLLAVMGAGDDVTQRPKTDWAQALGGSDRVFVYSAFLDRRLPDAPCIRIQALAHRKHVFVECSYWTASNRSATLQGFLRIIPEHHGLSYSAAFVECPIPSFNDSTGRQESTTNAQQSTSNEAEKSTSNAQKSSSEAGKVTATKSKSIAQDLKTDSQKLNSKAQNSTSNSQKSTLKTKKSTHKSQNSTSAAEEVHDLDPVVRVSVSTVQGKSLDYGASLPVDDLSKRKRQGQLNVCVKQFHSEHNKAARLVEFVELYKILGADYFTFYNLSVGPDVDAVLRYYVRRGEAEVLAFNSPSLKHGSYHTKGIFACLNDCNLRSVGRFPLVAMVDVDEFIVPRKAGNLVKMVQQQGQQHAVYTAKNAFFYLFYDDDKKAPVRVTPAATSSHNATVAPVAPVAPIAPVLIKSQVPPYLATQLKTTRVKRPNAFNDRSKYLCRPEKVLAAGNHYLHWWIGPKTVKHLDSNTALSHHYRACERPAEMTKCTNKTTTVDRFMHRYNHRLSAAVITACSSIFPLLNGCPVTAEASINTLNITSHTRSNTRNVSPKKTVVVN